MLELSILTVGHSRSQLDGCANCDVLHRPHDCLFSFRPADPSRRRVIIFRLCLHCWSLLVALLAYTPFFSLIDSIKHLIYHEIDFIDSFRFSIRAFKCVCLAANKSCHHATTRAPNINNIFKSTNVTLHVY